MEVIAGSYGRPYIASYGRPSRCFRASPRDETAALVGLGPGCWANLNGVRSRGEHYPAQFFPDGLFRQEKYRKPSGKVISDGYRQG